MKLPSFRFFVGVACLAASASHAAERVPLADIRQNLFSACFVDDREAWIVGELGRIFHTADGGGTFTRSPTGTRNALLAVACLPDHTVVTVGANGFALRSRDRGESWEPLATGTTRNLLSVSFADARTGIAVGDYGTMLRTEDGGTSWNQVALPDQVPLPEDVAEIVEPGDVLLYDVTFVGPERAWIVGEFGVILTSLDGGRTWSAQASPVETTLFGVGFADAARGWATGIDEVLLRTTDGGTTWEKQSIPAGPGFLLALYDVVVADEVGWAVGDSGYLLRTVDGGTTWEEVPLPIELAANWFRGLAVRNGDGFIVGSDGLLLVMDGKELRRPEPAS